MFDGFAAGGGDGGVERANAQPSELVLGRRERATAAKARKVFRYDSDGRNPFLDRADVTSDSSASATSASRIANTSVRNVRNEKERKK